MSTHGPWAAPPPEAGPWPTPDPLPPAAPVAAEIDLGRAPAASWWSRVAAFLLDLLPVLAGAALAAAGYGSALIRAGQLHQPGPAWAAGAWPLLTGGVLLLVGTVWTARNRWLTAGRTGQSWGKRVLGLHLVSAQTGWPPGPAAAFVRDLLHLLDAPGLGALWPLWDPSRQTFADLLAQTVVLGEPAELTAG